MYTQEDIDHAKEILTDSGYYLDNVWTTEDVDTVVDVLALSPDIFTQEEKIEILRDALENFNAEEAFDAIVDSINKFLK